MKVMTTEQSELLQKLTILALGDSDLVERAIKETAKYHDGVIQKRTHWWQFWIEDGKLLSPYSKLNDVIDYIEDHRKLEIS